MVSCAYSAAFPGITPSVTDGVECPVVKSGAERQRDYMERLRGGKPAIRYRKPQDRRSRATRWADALATLQQVVEEARKQRENMPPGIAESAYADELDTFTNEAEGWLERAPEYPAR
jgi:hypothetical protein